MKLQNFPLVRGGKLPEEALPWLAEVERVFPGATQDIILVRKPNSADHARPEIGNAAARKGKVE